MTTARIVVRPLHRIQQGHGKAFSAKPPRGPVRRPARVAIMLALAHKVRDAIEDGQLADQADAARRIGYTRGRISQLAALMCLAPDLQERVLFLEAIDGREPLTERGLRAVTKERDWSAQRRVCARVIADEARPRPIAAVAAETDTHRFYESKDPQTT